MILFVYYAKNGVFVIRFEYEALNQRVSTHPHRDFAGNAENAENGD